MIDEPTPLIPPYVSHTTLMSQIDRLRDEGIPSRIDKHFLIGMAGGTQYHFRQALKSLGFIADDDRPTPLLEEFVHAGPSERATLFGKIMTERFPELMDLPDNASKSDLLAVLQGYGVTSPDQQRKMLAFYVAAADYAGIPTSPHIRPTKARTGPRKPRTTRGKRKAAAGTAVQDGADSTAGMLSSGAVLSDEAMRSKYFMLLLAKADKGEADDKLLDRIERLVGTPGGETGKE